jgi:2-isopropylmalate synthase
VVHRLAHEPDASRGGARDGDQRRTVRGRGNGPIAAYVDALARLGIAVDVVDYREAARRRWR